MDGRRPRRPIRWRRHINAAVSGIVGGATAWVASSGMLTAAELGGAVAGLSAAAAIAYAVEGHRRAKEANLEWTARRDARRQIAELERHWSAAGLMSAPAPPDVASEGPDAGHPVRVRPGRGSRRGAGRGLRRSGERVGGGRAA